MVIGSTTVERNRHDHHDHHHHPHTPTGAVAGIGVASALVAAAGTAFGAHDWAEIVVVRRA